MASRYSFFALAVMLLLGAGAQAQAPTCPLPATWPEGVNQITFLGANAACPPAAAAASVTGCSQCICATLGAFQPAYLSQIANITTFTQLSDFLTLCLNSNQASGQFADVTSVEDGVTNCLSDSAFQAEVGNTASSIGSYCLAKFSPTGAAQPPSAATPPSPSSVDNVPPAPFEDSAAEESSGIEFLPPTPAPYGAVPPTPGTYPSTYPPPVASPPPRPPSAATLPVANLALQAAIAAVVLLASVMLF